MIRTFMIRQKTQLGVIAHLARFSAQAHPEIDQTEWDKALPFEQIPGPTVFQLFRNAVKGGKYYNLSLKKFHQCLRDDYGLIVKIPGMLGKKDIIISFDPKDYEKVFRNEGNWPIRRGMETFIYYRKNIRKDIFKDLGGLITEQGEPWHYFRNKVNPVMLQPKTVQLYTEKVDEIAREYMDMLAKMRDNNNELPANFNNEINKWALETMGVIALDTRLGVLYEDNTGDAAKIIQSIRDFFELAYNLEVQPSLWKLYSTRDFKKMMETFENLTSIIMKYVEDAAQNLKNSPPKPEGERGVLEKLLQIDQHIAIVMAFDMLLAGVDTTSAAVISTLYCLAKNPDKQEILREEIITILLDKTTPLTSQAMKNMPYLRAVIKEAMRLHPVTSGNFRATGRDIVLQGYRIPKDVDVAMSSLPMNEDEYIEHAESFIPERWLRDDSLDIQKARDSHPFVYLPFGFGPRTCIGRRFAQLELEVVVSRIIRQFLVEWKYPPIEYRLAIINIPKSELKFKLTDL